jgi:hypothetical protein
VTPVVLHADGTACRHAGGGPYVTAGDATLCPGGQQVTHVAFNGQVLTLAEATAVFGRLVAAFNEAVAPVLATLGAAARGLVAALAPHAEALAVRAPELPGPGDTHPDLP